VVDELQYFQNCSCMINFLK